MKPNPHMTMPSFTADALLLDDEMDNDMDLISNHRFIECDGSALRCGTLSEDFDDIAFA